MRSEKGRIDLGLVLTILALAVFFICGLRIFRDFGATPDEMIQVDGGHIYWRTLMRRLHRPYPADFDKLPELGDYVNRYYGQAAAFPTVLLEALRGWSMHSSTVIRVRHFWNFLMYFTGLCCFAAVLSHLYGDRRVCLLTVLQAMLLPRIFGDIFYNDRDIMLLSWMMISLAAFCLFARRPGWLTGLLCGIAFGVAVNTRIFGLVLLIFPALYFLCAKDKQHLIPLFIAMAAVWLLFYPIAWDHPLRTIPEAFRHLSTQQRSLETNNNATMLFFGEAVKENQLPWYFIPVYIFITTPLMASLAAAAGIFETLRGAVSQFGTAQTAAGPGPKLSGKGLRLLISCGMTVILAAVLLIGIVFRLTFYNGWRHFYFLYLPILWLYSAGICRLLKAKPAVRYGTVLFAAVSFILSILWIRQAHPYESIYLNPLFRGREGDFDRDYWRLSTTECLEWIGRQEPEEISVGEYNGSLDNASIGLMPELRRRLYIQHYLALHRYPPEYLIFNYSGTVGNVKEIPLYEPVYGVERDGIKLAEVFRRIPAAEVKLKQLTPAVPEIADGLPETQWRSPSPQSTEEQFIFAFEDPVPLTGLSVLPGDDEREYARDPEISISEDGETWTVLPITVTGLFDISFPETRTPLLRIRNRADADVHWSIRDIYFYSPRP